MQLAKASEILKPTVISFKHKDDTDLFGLGIQEEAPTAKDSSDEQEGKVIQQVVLKKILYTTDQNKAFDRSMIDWYKSKS